MRDGVRGCCAACGNGFCLGIGRAMERLTVWISTGNAEVVLSGKGGGRVPAGVVSGPGGAGRFAVPTGDQRLFWLLFGVLWRVVGRGERERSQGYVELRYGGWVCRTGRVKGAVVVQVTVAGCLVVMKWRGRGRAGRVAPCSVPETVNGRWGSVERPYRAVLARTGEVTASDVEETICAGRIILVRGLVGCSVVGVVLGGVLDGPNEGGVGDGGGFQWWMKRSQG